MKRRDPSRPWYQAGLRFECTQCGQCCSGPSGLVEFTQAEARGMAESLGLRVREFLETYAFRFEDGWALQEVEVAGVEGVDCALLGRDPETGRTWCRVHASRPAQCRTWPFWPENLRSPEAWRRAGRRCEGIGMGPVVGLEEIEADRDATPRI